MADPVVHITAGVPDAGTGNITTLGMLLAILPTALGAGGGLKVDSSGTPIPVSQAGIWSISQSGVWTVSANQTGNWSVRSQDGAGNPLTSVARGAQQALSIQVVDASGNQITSFGGAAPTATPVVSSALEAGHILKASAGSLSSFQVNTTTVGGWIMLFNSATVPADGAVTPIKWWQVGPNTTLGVGCSPALACAAGISIAFSTTGPFTKTGSATAVFSGEVA